MTKSFGDMAGPVKEDLPLAMIATRDIGPVAANALLKLDFEGKRPRELQGASDVTYVEVARIVGAAIGKPGLAYKQMPAEQLKPALLQMGMSSSMAGLLLQMADALDSGYVRTLEPRSPQSTTPTSLTTFINEVFVPAYRDTKAARA